MLKNKFRSGESGVYLCCFFAAAALILALTWPWVLHWRGEFLDHWDPPFHAWKLEFIARRILAGDVFVASGNTNMLYPHSGTLYYEALQWPPSLFAAALFGLTDMPSELVYHVTLLVFWAVSAPCMYFFLRQLNCRRLPSFFGAVAFCIIPHRISYMVEFQMEMIFPMPLFFAFLIRFFKKQKTADAVFAVLSCWLFAVTELYEAVFAVMAVPFIALSYISRTPSMVARKRFWTSGTIAAAVGFCSVFALLLPYLQQHENGMVFRSFSEVHRHSAGVFSMFVPFGRFLPWNLRAKVDEFSLYPTLAIFALSAYGSAIWLLRHKNVLRDRTPSNVLTALTFCCGLGFLFTAVLLNAEILPARRSMLYLWTLTGVCFLSSSVFACGFHDQSESDRSAFLRGFLAASVFFLFLSFGPNLVLGEEQRPIVSFRNPIYCFCRSYIMPFLSGFRVVSRFGVLVLFFLIAVASCSLDSAGRVFSGFAKRTRNICELALCLAFLCAVAIESVPNKRIVTKYRKIDAMRNSPAIGRLNERSRKCTLAVWPCGPRMIEGMRMFSMLKGDWPYIYAWGGYFPQYSEFLARQIGMADPTAIHRELDKFYPPCLLLYDKSNKLPLKKTTDGEIPPELTFREKGRLFLDYDKMYSQIADMIDSDDRFSVFRLKPFPPERSVQRIFRSDVGEANPVLSCSISAPPDSGVLAKFNGEVVFSGKSDETGRLDVELFLNPEKLEKSNPNVFEVCGLSTNLVSVSDFKLSGRDGKYHDVFAR